MLHDWFEHINSVNSDDILINHDPSIVFPSLFSIFFHVGWHGATHGRKEMKIPVPDELDGLVVKVGCPLGHGLPMGLQKG
jgi:hypothetical protein